ncbi:hypothetical protein LMANV2_270026 [Leptospira interrogans serovar Manilae]|uniref:Uncharacterized protein n=1 Tax=Leptospira interrogans serovar Manilae TaxID=214675 RepID=A0AAQ1NZX2_LEPIR|nr:hypothetical protein LMANV2_270026 [Leptospira interrogans serovar Manilae]
MISPYLSKTWILQRMQLFISIPYNCKSILKLYISLFTMRNN